LIKVLCLCKKEILVAFLFDRREHFVFGFRLGQSLAAQDRAVVILLLRD